MLWCTMHARMRTYTVTVCLIVNLRSLNWGWLWRYVPIRAFKKMKNIAIFQIWMNVTSLWRHHFMTVTSTLPASTLPVTLLVSVPLSLKICRLILTLGAGSVEVRRPNKNNVVLNSGSVASRFGFNFHMKLYTNGNISQSNVHCVLQIGQSERKNWQTWEVERRELASLKNKSI